MTRNKYRFWLLAFPDIRRPIGGIKQIHRLAESLSRLEHEAIIVQDDSKFSPGWFVSTVSTISRDDWFALDCLSSEFDIIILPETYLSSLLDIFPSIDKIIFNQNGAYTFGLKGVSEWNPEAVVNLYQHISVRQVWCVSKHDYLLLTKGLQLSDEKVFLLTNGIESSLVIPPNQIKKHQICYMPRKNSHDSLIVSSLLQRQSWFEGWQLLKIQDLEHSEVIRVFQESIIFLSFGHPEGFGLPVAEAMACGCSIVGYSGLGGRELFFHSQKFNLGIPVENGDWLGFLNGVKSLISIFQNSRSTYISNARKLSLYINKLYSFDSMVDSIVLALAELE